MILDLVNKTLKYTVILALIGMFIAWAFKLQNTFVEVQYINNTKILVFNWYKYQDTLTNAWSTNALAFEDILPSRQWLTTNANMFQQEFWNTIINDIAYVFDWTYFPINFIAYILRWIAWILKLALALIGWDFSMVNSTDYNSKIVNTLAWITQNLIIPYV